MLRPSLLHAVLVLALAIGCKSSRDHAPPPPNGKPSPGAVETIDLNKATLKQIEALPGIGPEKAKSILASRNARGGRFGKLDDLLAIDGVGEKTVEAIRPYVTLE